jgi:hypothetical protein
MEGNKSLLAQRDALREHSEDLESELTKVRASATENVAALEARVRSAEAHAVDVPAAGEKRIGSFEKELHKDLMELRALYECNAQSIGGLCSPMLEIEPSVMDYIRWLSTEVTGLPEVFARVNGNFISVTVEGTFVMAGGCVDLAALQASAVDSRANILSVERDV